MAAITEQEGARLLNAMFAGVAYPVSATQFMALLLDLPSHGAPAVEVSGATYARKSVTFPQATQGSAGITHSNAPTWTNASGASWGLVVGVGIVDTLTGGVIGKVAYLESAKEMGPGATLTFDPGACVWSVVEV